MKKLGYLLVVLMLAAGTTIAQERGEGQRPSRSGNQGMQGNQQRQQMTPEQRIERQTKQLVDELKLTKDQEAKVQAINKKYAEKSTFDRTKMRDASDEERTKMREEMKKVQDARNKEIKAVLTPDQVKLFDENQKKREEMRRNGQGRQGGGGGQQ